MGAAGRKARWWRWPKAALLRAKHEYLTSYKGLTFHTQSIEPLILPPGVALLTADSISAPES